jgi:hypothetical protein
MASDINASTAASALESTYRLKALQRPALLFDTYSYLHILTDPDETKSKGERGQGKYSDFEFSFETVTPEAITLTGNLQGSKLVLTKATADDAANFIKKVAETAKTFENINNFTTYFKRLTIGGNAIDIAIDSNLRTITFTYLEGNTVRTYTTTYYYTATGVALLESVVIGGVTINSLNNIQYSAANRRVNLTINNAAATITEADRPARVDVQAARNFFNTPKDDYWIAETGFTVNGVVDALKVSSIPNFYFLAFWPKYGTSGGRNYDIIGFVTYNQAQNRPELNYGPAAFPNLTADGRIVYTYLGMLGTLPPQNEPIVAATRQIWTDPQGFYVVQTSANSVDLVSAKDAKSWITLFN